MNISSDMFISVKNSDLMTVENCEILLSSIYAEYKIMLVLCFIFLGMIGFLLYRLKKCGGCVF